MKTNQSRTYLYLLIIILAIGALLRFKHINQPFIDYIDWRQVSTAMMAENFYRRNWNIFLPEISWDGPGPSYNGREFQTVSYMAALLYTILGQQDWIGRTVAVAFGIWGIFALYQLVKLLWGQPYAIASAGVMAFLPGSIFVDRSFIPDPAMVALVVTSFWMLVAYLQTDRWYYLVLASLVGTWGFLTKITGLIVGIPMLYTIWKFLKSREEIRFKKIGLISLIAVITLMPVIGYYLWARHLSLTYPPYHFAGSGNWLWDDGLKAWLDEKYFFPQLYWNYEHWIWTKPILILVIIGLVLVPPHSKQKLTVDPHSEMPLYPAPWVFHCWMLAGVIYYLIGAKELVINAWNFHILNPAAAALAGRAIVAIISWVNKIGRFTAAMLTLAAIVALLISFGQSHLKEMYNPPWNARDN